jgi:signal peptidase I
MQHKITYVVGQKPRRVPLALRLLAALRARLAGATIFEIPNTNLLPGLGLRDLAIVDRAAYASARARRHDIVVYRSEKHGGRLLASRVVGLPGERIELRDGRMHVNGVPIAEPFVDPGYATADYSRTWLCPPVHGGMVALLGDLRDGSEDSRHIGPIPAACLVGKVVGVAARCHAGLA